MAVASDADELIRKLPIGYIDFELIGSCFIYGEGKDVDILILVGGDFAEKHDALEIAGWVIPECESYRMDEDNWFSARKGLVNLLVTNSAEHYNAMFMGAKISKALADAGKLPKDDKWMRVIIHRALTGEGIGENPFV